MAVHIGHAGQQYLEQFVAGLRTAEVCGLRVTDIDYMRGVIRPVVQYPTEPLKTEVSKTPIPIPRSLANTLAAHVGRWPAEHVLIGGAGETGWQLGPWALERAVKAARSKVEDLPAEFRFHDLRHYLASLLIASGASVRSARLRAMSRRAAMFCATWMTCERVCMENTR